MKNFDYPILYEEDILKGFSEFRYLTREGVNLASMEDFGYLKDSRPKFNSFARRFRVAKSLKAVSFDKYGEGTAKGYEALNRHFLMFSAFERYVIDCEGIENRQYHLSLSKVPDYEFGQIKKAFDIVDTNDAVFKFLLENCNSTIQRISLRDFRKGGSKRTGLYISAMLRNSFVHGYLTANPRNAPNGAIEMLCNFMTTFLYDAICLDFETRLIEVRAELKEE